MFITINENNRNERKNSEKLKGVTLQNYLYLSCFLSITNELGTKLMLQMAPLVNSLMYKLAYLHIHKY